MGGEKSVDAVLDLVQSVKDDVAVLSRDVELCRQNIMKELRLLRSFIICSALLTFFGVAAVLWELGRLVQILSLLR